HKTIFLPPQMTRKTSRLPALVPPTLCDFTFARIKGGGGMQKPAGGDFTKPNPKVQNLLQMGNRSFYFFPLKKFALRDRWVLQSVGTKKRPFYQRHSGMLETM